MWTDRGREGVGVTLFIQNSHLTICTKKSRIWQPVLKAFNAATESLKDILSYCHTVILSYSLIRLYRHTTYSTYSIYNIYY